MMDRQWPSEFTADAKQRGANRVIGEETDPKVSTDCPNCGGSESMYAFYIDGGPFRNPSGGKVNKWLDLGAGPSWYVGELKSAPCPVCAGPKKAFWLEKVCGLSGIDLNTRLESFKAMPGKVKAKETAAHLLAMTPNPSGFVTFWGEFGTGKTTLLKCIINGFRVAGVLSVYARMSDLLAEVRDTFSDNAKGAAEALIREYRGTRVLAIDEIDRVNLTPWASETMFRLVDGRYESQDMILTVMATNLNPKMMEHEKWGYLSSRMTSGVIVEVSGVDVRPAIGLKAEKELREYAY